MNMLRTIVFLLIASLLSSCNALLGVSQEDANTFIEGETVKAQYFESQTTILNRLIDQVQASGVPSTQMDPIRMAAAQNAEGYHKVDQAQLDVLGELVELDYKALWKKFRDQLSGGTK